MSKKQARKYLQYLKPGCTVKEFLTYCEDMGTWFDTIQGTDLETCYHVLSK